MEDDRTIDEMLDEIEHSNETLIDILLRKYDDWVDEGIIVGLDPNDPDLGHIGTKYHSGRFPYGSGLNPYQHDPDFAGFVRKLRDDGYSYKDADGTILTGDKAIAKALGLTTTTFRKLYTISKNEERSRLVSKALSLQEEGLNPSQIAVKMGFKNESSVRSLLNEDARRRMEQAQVTADYLKSQVDKKGMIDVGGGVETELGISRVKLDEALLILEMQGYNTFPASVPQQTNPGRQTNLQVLCPPDTPYKVNDNGNKVSSYVYNNLDKVYSANDHMSYDDGKTFVPSFNYPTSIDSSRVQVLLRDDQHPKGGVGESRDGLIEIRPGVKDLSLGGSNYSQVRILVDGNRYLKGMAVYSDDLPDGVDIRFNSNKSSRDEAFKKISDNPDNPFGSLIKEHGGQSFYDDPKGKFIDPITGKHQSLSAINKRADEGDWDEWKKTLPSQFLSKQHEKLAAQQLKLAIADKEDGYSEIERISNPTVRRRFLESFADSCDYQAEHLQAAALPRQRYQVILPMDTLKDNEVYAPNYANGETVALIRFPHGGTFEIPILKVNNRNEEGIKAIGKNPRDAVGINKRVANRLSGADFDGDTVLVIPCNSSSSKVKITSTHPLAGLKDFDPTMTYGGKPEGTFRLMGENQTDREMGIISNLISDMTIQGAPESDLAKAVRHSMVVIDARKHKLDWKQSEVDNDIALLKKKYQGYTTSDGKRKGGASTIISRAKNEQDVIKRQGSPSIDPKTGRLVWKTADDATYVDRKTGEVKYRMQKSTQMAETDDAFTLVSEKNTPMERLYASYANKMKAMANRARLESLATPDVPYSPAARKQYQSEVKSLNEKIKLAEANRPREREAQLITLREVALKKQLYPSMKKEEIKKATQQTLTRARIQVGSKKDYVTFTEKEIEAIQKGAISGTALSKLIDNAKDEYLKEVFTPRTTQSVSAAKEAKIKAMLLSGYTNEEIATAVGLSISTVNGCIHDLKE